MNPTPAPTRADDAVPGSPNDSPRRASRWGKRLGTAAFLFFLIKGVAWLVVPAAAAYLASR